MPLKSNDQLTSITLEQPLSVRRQHPTLVDLAWMIPQYVGGPENEQLRFLFDDPQLLQLADFSPVVLYGDSGTGKTALAVTLAVRWSRSTDQRPLAFSTGSAFGEDHVEALQADDIEHFRRRYRRCKLLLLDDLEPLITRPAGQEELANTLDSLMESGQPVIVTAKRLPATMRGLRSNLASRLTGGLSIELRHPGIEARTRIVKELLSICDPTLPATELMQFFNGFSESLKVKQLKDLITIASQHRKLTGQFDLSQLRSLSRQQQMDASPKMMTIANAVARRFQIRLADMRGSTRQANVVRARGLAIFLARRLTTLSLQDIGKYFGDRDHSTIIHACRKIQDQLNLDVDLALAHSELQQDLIRGVALDD